VSRRAGHHQSPLPHAVRSAARTLISRSFTTKTAKDAGMKQNATEMTMAAATPFACRGGMRQAGARPLWALGARRCARFL
jgi:hypothetical protein